MKGKVTYLNCTNTSRFSLALKTAAQHFNKNCFVPGFADMLVLTSQVLKTKGQMKGQHSFQLTICKPGEVPANTPDVVWIDDVTLPSVIVRRMMIKYASCSIYLSCGSEGNKPKIIADTREQKPMFAGKDCRKMKLDVGDYTTDTLLHSFHIERKSPMDLYGTLTKGHVRFRNELILATVNEIKLSIYVETTREKFLSLKFPGGKLRKMPGETLLKIVRTMEKNYKTEVVWCRDRADCKKQILLRFKKEELLRK